MDKNSITMLITPTLKEKLSLMIKIYSSNKLSDNYPKSIKIDTSGTLHAINPLVSLSYKLGAEELGLVPELPSASFLLPDEAVKYILANDNGSYISINEGVNGVINIATQKKKYSASFNGTEVEKFPKIEAISPKELINQTMPVDFFENAIKTCSFAMSSNKSQLIYNAIHFIAQNNTFTAFSCNTLTSAIYQKNFDNLNNKIFISVPRETVSILQNCLKLSGNDIAVGITENKRKAVFVLDSNTILRTALLIGNVIDYKFLFDTLNKKSFEVKASLITSALKKIKVLSQSDDEYIPVKLTVHADSINFSFDNGKTKYNEEIEISNNCNFKDDILIALNPDFFDSSIKSIDDEYLKIYYLNAATPLIISGKNNLSAKATLAPVRIR